MSVVGTHTFGSYGAGKWHVVKARNVDPTDPGDFLFSERFYRTLDKRFDYELHLGVRMSHSGTNMNKTNSWLWNGFTKFGRIIKELFLKDVYIMMEEPSSEQAAYTDIQCAMSDVDQGITQMPDMGFEGILAFGWIKNFYAANAADAGTQNKLEVWNGAALLDMNNYLYGAVHNRLAMFNWQSPKHYHYDLLPLTKPLYFGHRSNAYVTAHSAYAMMKVVAMVKLFP